MPAVILENVSKCYQIYARPIDRLAELALNHRRCFHKKFWALQDINLTFEKGTTTALLGPNGSGKSTTLQLIASVLQPTTGNIHINGRLTAILELGAGFQPEHTGRENVLLYGMILGIAQDEMLAKMDSIADFAQIGDFFDQPVKTYSSGMLVRLAFSAAINVNPEILLVDEALAVGDKRFQRKCIEKITELQKRGKTIIFVSHDTLTVRLFCTRAILLNKGKIQEQGSVDKVVKAYEELMGEGGIIAPNVFVQTTGLLVSGVRFLD
jgi:ABC-type polysaccharide/polyol phosphate transport system ATPase subunit